MTQNPDEKTDRRTMYTRMVVREALFELLKEKHLPQITVKEICEKAQINRATFYRNYSDIYDLFEQCEKELTEKAFASGGIEESRYSLLEIIYKNQDFYREFFDSGLESRFVRSAVKKISQEMKTLLKKRGTLDERTFEISYQYNYYGALGVIREWLNGGCRQEPRKFGDILYKIVEKQYS